MNAKTERPDDALLSAWLDGEVEGPDCARIQTWLHENPEDAARVRLWAADRDALRARYSNTLDEPVPDRLVQTVWRRGSRARFGAWPQAVAAVVLVALGATLGALWRGGLPRDSVIPPTAALGWPQRAAVAHAIYAPEERHPVEVSVREGDEGKQREQETHLSRWLTRRLSVPVRLFDLRAEGFELVGGRLLPDASGPSAQLMYQDTMGQRVTVYLRKADREASAAFRFERRGDLSMFYWVDGLCGYALVGPQSRERLLSLAQAIAKQDPPAAGSR